MFSYITRSIIPIIVLIIITYGMIKGRKVYEWFIEGAKEGLKVCVNIFPYLLDMLNNAVSPLCKLIDLPKEIVPLVLIKPLSGSGAMGVFTDILKNYGAEKAWLKIQSIDESACIHRLMALEGAILGIKKSELPQIRKDELKEFYNKHKK